MVSTATFTSSALSVHHDLQYGVFFALDTHNISLIPRLSWNANIYRAESLVSFLRKHDVIKIRPKQKGNVLHVVQLIMLQRSVCMILNA